MKKIVFLLLIASNNLVMAQTNWFTRYSDSIALVKDGNIITDKFIEDVRRIKPDIEFNVKTILNTTPYLIYYDGHVKTANLPLWSQVIPEQQRFFYEVAGSELEGKNAFGYFFNGFYLPHELGHALQEIMEGNLQGSYENEYFANTIAFLWWKKKGREKELEQCYESAKKMWEKLPNPIPQGMTIQEFFSKNYEKASENPYVYGYMQFKQFILIYEDKNLPNFDNFVRNYLSKK
jgi:hypothetical protein